MPRSTRPDQSRVVCGNCGLQAVADAQFRQHALHVAGPDAIRAEYARWFADPARFDELHHYRVSGGASDVIEYTLSWSENGVPHAAHHLHLLTVRDGLIAADTVFCGGRWPASLLAEMEAADA